MKKKKIKMKFISRHTPTPAQIALAAEQGLELVHVGDMDAFNVDFESVMDDGCRYVAVVHPWAALRFAAAGCWVGVFENANRAPEGERPQFEATALHLHPPMEVY